MDYIGNHVTYDQIRGAAGVSVVEVSNAEIDAFAIEQTLQLAVASWIPAATDTDAIYTDGTDPGATTAEKHTLYAFSAYLKNYAAYLLFLTGKLKFAKKISDSDNSFERYGWEDDAIAARLLAQANQAQDQFLGLIGEEATGYATNIFMGRSEPAFDPVTG